MMLEHTLRSQYDEIKKSPIKALQLALQFIDTLLNKKKFSLSDTRQMQMFSILSY